MSSNLKELKLDSLYIVKLIFEPTWSSHIVGLTSSSQSALPSQSLKVFVPSRSVEENQSIKYQSDTNQLYCKCGTSDFKSTFNSIKNMWVKVHTIQERRVCEYMFVVSECVLLPLCVYWLEAVVESHPLWPITSSVPDPHPETHRQRTWGSE